MKSSIHLESLRGGDDVSDVDDYDVLDDDASADDDDDYDGDDADDQPLPSPLSRPRQQLRARV